MTAGRKSELNKELKLEIRKLILKGELKKDIALKLGIPEGTWDYWLWNNSQGLRNDVTEWENEYLVKVSKGNLTTLLNAEDERVMADMTKYTLDRLDKAHFSTRQELTGKDGKDLLPKPMVDVTKLKEEDGVFNNNSNEEDSEAGAED